MTMFQKIMIFFSGIFIAIALVKISIGVSVTQSITAIIFGLLAIISATFFR